MSAGPVGKVLEHYPGSGNELLLAIVIADEATRAGTFRLLVKDLARLSRQTEQNVRRLIRKMEDDGWLLYTDKGGGRGRPSEYAINPDWLRQPLGWLPNREKPEKPENPEHLDVRVSGAKPENNVRVSGEKPELNVRVSGGTPLFEDISPLCISPQTDGSAVPSAIDQDRKLAEWMFSQLLKLNPELTAPNWKRWCRDIATLRRQGRSHHDIAVLFRWANGEPFWQGVIDSPKALLQNWNKLTLQRGKAPAAPPAPKPEDRLCADCKAAPATVHMQNQPPRCDACNDKHERRAA